MGRPRKRPKSIANSTANGIACQKLQPAMPVLGRRGQQRHRVRADRVEGDEAQVEEAGQAEGDVEAEAQQHEQGDEGDDLGEEGAQREREEQDEGEDQDGERRR